MAFQGGSIHRVEAPGKRHAELLAKHPFPGIELEADFDGHIVGIDEFALGGAADHVHRNELGRGAGLTRGVRQIDERAGILGIVEHAGEMDRAAGLRRARRGPAGCRPRGQR